MQVRDIMTTDVRLAAPDDDLQKAAATMARDGFGSLPVVDGDKLVGMLTDRDITVRAVAHGLSPAKCTVREVMSPDVRFVYDDESVEDAAAAMSKLKVRRLPVLDAHHRLVGIVALADVAVTEPEPAGVALTSISQPG
jgi:CBS domain-containing protein